MFIREPPMRLMPMPTVNSKYLEKAANKLFTTDDERREFIKQFDVLRVQEQAALWVKEKPADCNLPALPSLPWQPDFVDRLVPGHAAGKNELHDRGFYYLLDLSSVFAAQVLTAVSEKPLYALDVCAAPGGKGIFAWKLLAPAFFTANEAIGKRLGQLVSNLSRCGVAPAAVLNEDPSRLVQFFGPSFGLVIVDAPCSGQSLVLKGISAPGCFNPAVINMNSNRQKRIAACSAGLVSPGGWLAYMTCTYSREENEDVISWLLTRFPDFHPVEVPLLNDYRSRLAPFPCYRLWPQSGTGAGAFAALLRREGLLSEHSPNLDGIRTAWTSGEVPAADED